MFRIPLPVLRIGALSKCFMAISYPELSYFALIPEAFIHEIKHHHRQL